MAWIAEWRRRSRFETVVLPHLDAAYALARWLTRNGPRRYQTMHGMNDPAPERCPNCGAPLHRQISAPRINWYSFSSPTEAKYAKVSASEEIAKERELQKVDKRMWLPPPVKHSPWE